MLNYRIKSSINDLNFKRNCYIIHISHAKGDIE